MNIMAGFAVYQLLNVHTGMALYSTTATQDEIQMANQNLQMQGQPTRFVPVQVAPSFSTALKAA